MYAMMNGIIFVSIIALAFGQDVMTTTMTMNSTHHGHREQPEKSSVSFFYDNHSQYMVMKTGGYCYFMQLNMAEQQMVHNPDGLRRIETQAFHMMTSANHLAMTGADHYHISRYVYTKICAHEHLIKLAQ